MQLAVDTDTLVANGVAVESLRGLRRVLFVEVKVQQKRRDQGAPPPPPRRLGVRQR